MITSLIPGSAGAAHLPPTGPANFGVGPKPGGPSHPTPTGPPPRPNLAELVAKAKRLGAELLALLDSEVDPVSLPRNLRQRVDAEASVYEAARHVSYALEQLARVADIPTPDHGRASGRVDPGAPVPVDGSAGAAASPSPGADAFSLPATPRPPAFEVGTGPLYDALPRRGV